MAADQEDLTRVHTMHDLGALLGEAGHDAEAREVFEKVIEQAPGLGYSFLALSSTVQIGFIELHQRRFEEARRHFASALDQAREIGHYNTDIFARWGLGYAALGLGRRDEARATFDEALDVVLAAPQIAPHHFSLIASGIAHAAEPEQVRTAARLRGAITGLRANLGLHDDPRNIENERFFDRGLIVLLGEEAWALAQAEGADMTLEETFELARSLVGRSPAE
jgi:tetratricopeptide (TPR) repeat protein